MFILITYGNLMTLFFCYIPDVVNTALTELLPSLSTTILSSCTRKLLLFLKSMVKSLLFIRTIRPATRNDKIWSNLSCTHYQIGTKNKEKKKKHTLTQHSDTWVCCAKGDLLPSCTFAMSKRQKMIPPLKVEGNKTKILRIFTVTLAYVK